MSYTRVFIFEPPKGFTHHMKVFKSETKPMLDKLKKEKNHSPVVFDQNQRQQGHVYF